MSDISDIGEEAIIMFEEEGGVGAEEVVGTEEFVTCFVDNSQVGFCHCDLLASNHDKFRSEKVLATNLS